MCLQVRGRVSGVRACTRDIITVLENFLRIPFAPFICALSGVKRSLGGGCVWVGGLEVFDSGIKLAMKKV